jgi:hypothetical protein
VFHFATSKSVVVNSTMFHIETFINTSRYLLMGRLSHITYCNKYTGILDVQSFRRAVGGTDHYLVVAKVTARLSVNKKTAQKFDVEKFNLRKLNEVEVRELCQMKTSNRCSVDTKDMSRPGEHIKQNIRFSTKESLGLYEQKQAKVQCLQDPHVGNLNNIGC